MKKVVIVLLSILFVIPIVGCTNKDAKKFKEEYEKLNNTPTSSGKITREVNIDKNNPFVYKTAEDIVTMLNNKESFVVYFGFNSCPWCRSMIENLIKAAKDTNTKTIYYVDVLNIRDVIKVDSTGETYKEKAGDPYYMQLLTMIGNVLEDYILTNAGQKIETGEKRIYAPNVVVVENGKAVRMTTGVSDKETDSYMELTDEINKESYDMLKEALEQNTTCTKEGAC